MPEPEPVHASVPVPAGTQRRAIQVLAFAAALVIVRLALPLGAGLLLGVLLAFVLLPVHRRLVERKIKASLAALICALGSTLVIAGVVFGLGFLFVSQGVEVAQSLPASFAPGGEFHALVAGAGSLISRFHINPEELTAKLHDAAVATGTKAVTLAGVVAGLTFQGFLMLLFLTLMTFYVLLHWTELVQRGERDLPFKPATTRALLEEFREVGRQVLFGTISTGLIQGVLSGLGYWATGVPRPALFGALTAVASLIPAIGTVLAWGAIGIFLLITGHPLAGASELVYGALVVGVVTDYVIRPRLVGSKDDMPAVLIFIGLLGGTEVFGLIGLVLGPVIVTMCVAVLRIYDAEAAPNPHVDAQGT